MKKIIITTGNDVPNKRIKEVLGLAQGSTVRTKHIGNDIGAVIKSFFGGEVKAYTNMTLKSREEAYRRMLLEAEKMNADAIIGVRFSTSVVMSGASEMLAYGTAVRFFEEG